MYRAYYKLNKKPFQITTDPNFLWLGEMHRNVLSAIKHGVLSNAGLLLLTGEVGTGKTTLINALTNSLGHKVIIARVPDPGMQLVDFINYLCHAFDIKKEFTAKGSFLVHFNHFLNSARVSNKKVLLIIDESQRLRAELLEEIKILAKLEAGGEKLLNVLIVGQTELSQELSKAENRELREQICITQSLQPLSLSETREVINYRLGVAGAQNSIFTDQAIKDVHEFSGGFPRRINIICDHALMMGCRKGAKQISAELVAQSAAALVLPRFGPEEQIEGAQVIPQAVVDEAVPGSELITLEYEDSYRRTSRTDWLTATMMAVLLIVGALYAQNKRDVALTATLNSDGAQSDNQSSVVADYPEPAFQERDGLSNQLEQSTTRIDNQESIQEQSSAVDGVLQYPAIEVNIQGMAVAKRTGAVAKEQIEVLATETEPVLQEPALAEKELRDDPAGSSEVAVQNEPVDDEADQAALTTAKSKEKAQQRPAEDHIDNSDLPHLFTAEAAMTMLDEESFLPFIGQIQFYADSNTIASQLAGQMAFQESKGLIGIVPVPTQPLHPLANSNQSVVLLEQPVVVEQSIAHGTITADVAVEEDMVQAYSEGSANIEVLEAQENKVVRRKQEMPAKAQSQVAAPKKEVVKSAKQEPQSQKVAPEKNVAKSVKKVTKDPLALPQVDLSDLPLFHIERASSTVATSDAGKAGESRSGEFSVDGYEVILSPDEAIKKRNKKTVYSD